MVKPLSFQTTETQSDFQPVPLNMGYQDAVRLLKGDGSIPIVPKSAGEVSSASASLTH
jgi:hypothetical protein